MERKGNYPTTYRSILGLSQGIYREKGSKFLGYVLPISDEVAFKAQLDQIKSDHPKARHYCYAFRLGLSGQLFRSSDDGEPSGTAGRPILHILTSHELVQVGAIVVRYFGGTKLGTSGLIRAYKSATQSAIENGQVSTMQITSHYRVRVGYQHINDFLSKVTSMGAVIGEREYGPQKVIVHYNIPKQSQSTFNQKIVSALLNIPEESVDLKKIEEVLAPEYLGSNIE